MGGGQAWVITETLRFTTLSRKFIDFLFTWMQVHLINPFDTIGVCDTLTPLAHIWL